jgi:site-specific DNA-methyltransferase (adenine-specific)
VKENKPVRNIKTQTLIPSAATMSWWETEPNDSFYQGSIGEIVCSDALEFLNSLKRGCADIIFLDPPFNLGKQYDAINSSSDQMREDEYFSFMTAVIRRSSEILKDGGALYLYHIPRWALKLAPIADPLLTFRHWIVVSMKNGFVRGNRLYPAHYALLYFTKGDPIFFHRPKIPVPTCRHCKKYIKDYGGYKKYIEEGINLSDIWEDISPVRHKKYKNRVANELPIEILRRVVAISGPQNGVLVDPFAGTGTSLVAAFEKGMRFIGCDRVQSNCTIMVKRLGQLSQRSDANAPKQG